MPWDAKSFANKHNHALKGARAKKAAAQANAILKKTGDMTAQKKVLITREMEAAGLHALADSLYGSELCVESDLVRAVYRAIPRTFASNLRRLVCGSRYAPSADTS